MSGKLDQSLDEILSTKPAARRGRGRRAVSGRVNGGAAVAPTGGIKKNTRTTRATGKAMVPMGPASGSGDSKVIVSNLVGRPS